MPAAGSLLPLDEVLARAEHLVSRSPADATSVCWLERSLGTATESARARRAERGAGRAVVVRVRLAGRSGFARGETADSGALETLLRLALADARAAAPSPDWDVAAAAGEVAALADLHDPAVEDLEPGAAGALLERLAQKRATLRLRWTDLRLAVAASFHPPRALRATEATLEARTGRRPGSGFAAATRRRLAGLEVERVVEAARGLEAPAVTTDALAPGSPLLLAPEAAVALVDAYGRRALGTRRTGCGDPSPADAGSGPAPSLAVHLRDEPLAAEGAPLPFDLDGAPKQARDFVRGGLRLETALDLELAARAGRAPTGHGLAGDEAWPSHLALAPGAEPEEALRRSAGGGVRVGALEELSVESGAPWRFRAVARSLRRIGRDGELGDALAPRIWTGDLVGCLAAVAATSNASVAWAPAPNDALGACRAPAALLTGHGAFTPRALV